MELGLAEVGENEIQNKNGDVLLSSIRGGWVHCIETRRKACVNTPIGGQAETRWASSTEFRLSPQ